MMVFVAHEIQVLPLQERKRKLKTNHTHAESRLLGNNQSKVARHALLCSDFALRQCRPLAHSTTEEVSVQCIETFTKQPRMVSQPPFTM
ncbi:hypothetical protein CEXT_682541 [Caerostris extrusa]|uniref:Uncharacterized protein n=1 Tax=Caerostris extrusa TaxID=172846 RepID=A0AAV4T0Z9_CAEEX|nr:hypothetical protein CEXT_682541 [Caerostris extrusa]